MRILFSSQSTGMTSTTLSLTSYYRWQMTLLMAMLSSISISFYLIVCPMFFRLRWVAMRLKPLNH